MIQGIMQYDFNNLMCKANRIAKAGLDYILDFEDVLNIEDGVRFKRIRNTSKFRFVMRHDNTKFEIEIPEDESPEIHSKYWKQVSIQNAVNSRTKFREILFRNDIGDQITHAYPDIEWNEEFHDKYETYIIQGISYSSDEDSQMGRGYIYATAKYNKNDSSNADLINKPRYDFVLIKFEGYNTPTLARIIIMFTIDAITENSAEENQIMVVLQLLTESDDKEDANMINQSMGPVYKWAGLIRGSMSGSHVIVAVQSIMRPIFVVPIFREGYNDLKPSPIDRYVALDRHFFERSGWDVENNSSISFHTVEDQMSYLSVNQTAAKLFMSSSIDKERNIPPPDDDDNSSTGTMCTSSDEEDSC